MDMVVLVSGEMDAVKALPGGPGAAREGMCW